ncbi:hypothetical protein ILUMI_11339, partial [Ignelater luminosus]
VEVQAYKFMSNEYRFFPITVSVNACVEYNRNIVGYKELLVKTSNIDPCNFHK